MTRVVKGNLGFGDSCSLKLGFGISACLKLGFSKATYENGILDILKLKLGFPQPVLSAFQNAQIFSWPRYARHGYLFLFYSFLIYEF